ncbi:MAG: hypothetical protein FWD77_01495 [Betaproteobacteria bacterium]|nr:hypothetical protein [Betaproteobacteria bacterium]
MTIVGAGGAQLKALFRLSRFKKDYKRLSPDLQDRADLALGKLLQDPRPPGLGFEKLKGYQNPDIYTIHVTGNFKISFEIDGDTAYLRRIAKHDEIDDNP